jgi:hypothetical protein
MAERLTVAQVVVGSSPIIRPHLECQKRSFEAVFDSPLEMFILRYLNQITEADKMTHVIVPLTRCDQRSCSHAVCLGMIMDVNP